MHRWQPSEASQALAEAQARSMAQRRQWSEEHAAVKAAEAARLEQQRKLDILKAVGGANAGQPADVSEAAVSAVDALLEAIDGASPQLAPKLSTLVDSIAGSDSQDAGVVSTLAELREMEGLGPELELVLDQVQAVLDHRRDSHDRHGDEVDGAVAVTQVEQTLNWPLSRQVQVEQLSLLEPEARARAAIAAERAALQRARTAEAEHRMRDLQRQRDEARVRGAVAALRFPELEGWLQIELSPGRWHDRWLKLSGHRLSWFANPRDRTAKGSLAIEAGSIETDESAMTLTVVVSDDAQLRLRAKVVNKWADWRSNLEHSVTLRQKKATAMCLETADPALLGYFAVLVLAVVRANGLHDGQSFGNLDPYVKCTPEGWAPVLKDQQAPWQKTVTLRAAGSNPEWSPASELRWCMESAEQLNKGTLVVEAWDEDDVVDCFIGAATIELRNLDRTGFPASEVLTLKNRQGGAAGSLQVMIQLQL